jgi:hypothetical protein
MFVVVASGNACSPALNLCGSDPADQLGATTEGQCSNQVGEALLRPQSPARHVQLPAGCSPAPLPDPAAQRHAWHTLPGFFLYLIPTPETAKRQAYSAPLSIPTDAGAERISASPSLQPEAVEHRAHPAPVGRSHSSACRCSHGDGVPAMRYYPGSPPVPDLRPVYSRRCHSHLCTTKTVCAHLCAGCFWVKTRCARVCDGHSYAAVHQPHTNGADFTTAPSARGTGAHIDTSRRTPPAAAHTPRSAVRGGCGGAQRLLDTPRHLLGPNTLWYQRTVAVLQAACAALACCLSRDVESLRVGDGSIWKHLSSLGGVRGSDKVQEAVGSDCAVQTWLRRSLPCCGPRLLLQR